MKNDKPVFYRLKNNRIIARPICEECFCERRTIFDRGEVRCKKFEMPLCSAHKEVHFC